jgi:hypothetical protein
MERVRQRRRWGVQEHPDGTGTAKDREYRAKAQAACDRAAFDGSQTWRHILAEEVAEAFAERDPAALRAELVQVAAVALQWVEALDARQRRVP